MKLTWFEFDIIQGGLVKQRDILGIHDDLDPFALDPDIVLLRIVETHPIIDAPIRFAPGGQAQTHTLGAALFGRLENLFGGSGCQLEHLGSPRQTGKPAVAHTDLI